MDSMGSRPGIRGDIVTGIGIGLPEMDRAPEPGPHVFAEASRTQTLIADLHQGIDRLTERLHAVIVPFPQEDGQPATPDPVRCQLAGEMAMTNDKLWSAVRRIAMLADSIDL